MFTVIAWDDVGEELKIEKIQWLPEAIEKLKEFFGLPGVSMVSIDKETK